MIGCCLLVPVPAVKHNEQKTANTAVCTNNQQLSTELKTKLSLLHQNFGTDLTTECDSFLINVYNIEAPILISLETKKLFFS